MRYIFENENAIELYYVITKELGIEMIPGDSFDNEVYLSEKFLTDTLTDMHQKFTYDKRRKKFHK